MLDPHASQPPDEGTVRERLARLLVQIQLTEVLYLRLVGIEVHRLAGPEQDARLRAESLRLERELRAAQTELERLGRGLRVENDALPPRPGPGF